MLTSIEQMEANVAKFKHDIELDDKKYNADIRKFIIQTAVAFVATVATSVVATVATMNYLDHHYTPVAQSRGTP
jgi:hypothetical protein